MQLITAWKIQHSIKWSSIISLKLIKLKITLKQDVSCRILHANQVN